MAEIEELDGYAETMEVSFDVLFTCIKDLEKIFSGMSKLLSDETTDRSGDAPLIVQWGREAKELEDREKKLIDEYNEVMSNLYLLPGYVLAVTSAVSGLLSADPHTCWLLSNIIAVVILFLVALWLAVRFAYRHLISLQAKTQEVVVERTRFHRSFLTHVNSFGEHIRSTNPVLKKLENYETMNSELHFQVQHYYKFLLLITLCGILYAFMLLLAGYHVLCGGQSKDRLPCTLHSDM